MNDPSRRVAVRSVQGDYEVRIGAGTLRDLHECVSELVPRPSSVVLVVDANVLARHEAAIEAAMGSFPAADRIAIPGGEPAKHWEGLGALLEEFSRVRLDRRSLVLAIGGGACTDLAGLAAALWMRGVRWATVPTTVLAAVDASVGGKTAVNLDSGKNLVGAFHAPRFVVVDPAFFTTLPEREVRSGLAEVVKAGLIGDRLLFEALEKEGTVEGLGTRWPELLQRSIEVKADIVSRDEHEGSIRRHLNLGHTLGHALEKAVPLRLTHGEAVAIGMVAACDFASVRGLCSPDVGERTRRLLSSLGLPIHPPLDLPPQRVAALLERDKKNVSGRLTYVLPRAIGEVFVSEDVEPGEVLDWVQRHAS